MTDAPLPREGLARIGEAAALTAVRALGRATGLHHWGGSHAVRVASELRWKVESGRGAVLLGLNLGPHDSGAALVRIGRDRKLELISSYEEERFSRIRQDGGPPRHSLRAALGDLQGLGLTPSDIDAAAGGFDYGQAIASGVRELLRWAPQSFKYYFRPGFYGAQNLRIPLVFHRSRRLLRELGLRGLPLLGMPHHDNHAYFAWAASPFTSDPGRTGIVVMDGSGDEGSQSLYVAQDGVLRRVQANRDFWSSAGHFYGVLSAALGGWPPGASEGRWMAAAAYGQPSREANSFYPILRQLVRFQPEGSFSLDWTLANWQIGGLLQPFRPGFEATIGRAIPPSLYHQEGLTLSFDPDRIGPNDRRRAELAAATQMVFEDIVSHVVDWLIERHGVSNVILTGGTALNCVSNGLLNDRLTRSSAPTPSRCRLWIPPVPADDGVAAGAAYQLALRSGALPGDPIRHAFYGLEAPTSAELERALEAQGGLHATPVGNTRTEAAMRIVAEAVVERIARGQLVGVFVGRAEVGRRALGHRSLLADPRDPGLSSKINQLKLREPFRPVAPMCSVSAASRFFELDPAHGATDRSPYAWMALTARARPEAAATIPGVIHGDGTARLQIVRPEDEPWLQALLSAASRFIGVEMLANTSLNVREPIAAAIPDALRLLGRAPLLRCLLFASKEQDAFIVERTRR